MELKVAVIWNVRPTPSRQTRRGFRPVMSRPSSRTLPASGGNWPFSMLKQVLLPAPLGPISASISPGARVKETPCTARTPPKDFCRSSTSSVWAGMPCLPARPRGAGQALREEQHQRDNDDAEHQPPEIGEACQLLL